jgi:hypothetical protein
MPIHFLVWRIVCTNVAKVANLRSFVPNALNVPGIDIHLTSWLSSTTTTLVVPTPPQSAVSHLTGSVQLMPLATGRSGSVEGARTNARQFIKTHSARA